MAPFHPLIDINREIDLIIEFSPQEIRAIEIKSGLTAKPSKGYYSTLESVVYAGNTDFPITKSVEVVSLWTIVDKIKTLA